MSRGPLPPPLPWLDMARRQAEQIFWKSRVLGLKPHSLVLQRQSKLCGSPHKDLCDEWFRAIKIVEVPQIISLLFLVTDTCRYDIQIFAQRFVKSIKFCYIRKECKGL